MLLAFLVFKNYFRSNKAEKSSCHFFVFVNLITLWVELWEHGLESPVHAMNDLFTLHPYLVSCPAERGLEGYFVLFDYRMLGGGAMIALSF